MRLTCRLARWAAVAAGALSALLLACPGSAQAQPGFRNNRFAAIVVEADSGRTLFARKADASRRPASLTKVMTLYVAFDEIERGRLRMSDRIVVSPHAAAQPPTKAWLRAGSRLTVREAIDLIAVKSANDAAVALAEHIGGSEARFARRMNRTARKLGMRSTHFSNASGLPAASQRTTARDLARLARAFLEHHPDGYRVFAKDHTVFHSQRVNGHNRLLQSPGIDGIKTGYIRASGFNLMSSGVRDGNRLVAVVLGGDTAAIRDAYMRRLLDRNFAKLSAERVQVAAQTRASPPAPQAPAAQASATQPTEASELLWVQVGAFASRERAWAHLDELARRHPARFAAAPRGVDQPGDLYQARINVFSEDDARETCKVLKSEGEACFWFGTAASS